MATLPVYCANCEKWVPSGISVGSGSGTMSIGIGVGASTPCPQCGGLVPYIPGDYNIIEGAFEIVKSQNLTDEELKALTRIFQQAMERNTSVEQLREIIAREVPKASGFIQLLNKFVDDRRGLFALLALLVSVLSPLLPYIKPPSNNDDLNTEKIVKAIRESKPQATPEPKKKAKIAKPAKKKKGLKRHQKSPHNLNQKPK